MTLISTTIMFSQKQLNILTTWTVTSDVYKSMYAEWWRNQFSVAPKINQRIHPMGFCAHSENYSLQGWINRLNIDHKISMTILSTTVMCAPKQLKTIMEWNFPCDVYKSFFVEWKYNQRVIPPKKLQGINPMGLCSPCSESYSQNWIKQTNIDHQT